MMNNNQPDQSNQSDPTRSDQESSSAETPDAEPESGFVDRQERMSVRQSSPTNPRVNEKSEENQEEA